MYECRALYCTFTAYMTFSVTKNPNKLRCAMQKKNRLTRRHFNVRVVVLVLHEYLVTFHLIYVYKDNVSKYLY